MVEAFFFTGMIIGQYCEVNLGRRQQVVGRGAALRDLNN